MPRQLSQVSDRRPSPTSYSMYIIIVKHGESEHDTVLRTSYNDQCHMMRPPECLQVRSIFAKHVLGYVASSSDYYSTTDGVQSSLLHSISTAKVVMLGLSALQNDQ